MRTKHFKVLSFLPSKTPNKVYALSMLAAFVAGFFIVFSPQKAEACEFLIPDANGNAIKGPSFDTLDDGFLTGLLDCGAETHRLMVMTIHVDISQKHIGVRDDPLFTTEITGALKPLDDIPVSATSSVHVMSRVNQSPFIGVRRGNVHFATLCETKFETTPLDCSWGKSRIKFRSTILDTDLDQIFDRSYHELSVFSSNGRLHMITFWTPHRQKISNTTADWISALEAFGLNITTAG